MKKGILSLIAWSLPFLLQAQNNASTSPSMTNENGIQWVTGLTWDQVKQKAKQENKFIFIDAYATWCGPCKKMDKEVYPDENVGKIVNPKFISVKVQMDQTKNDNEQVKNWYPIAKKLSEDYSVEGFPSFLFFNSDGKMVHKGLGYRDATGLIELAKDALTDPEARYKKSVEKFRLGQLDYASMPEVITQAWNKKDKETATQLIKTYKEKYLDSLTNEQVFNKESLEFVARWSLPIVTSKDRYFKLFYNHPDLADSIMKSQLSRLAVLRVIQKEEINDKIYKDGKSITNPKPNWKKYQQTITTKYGKKYTDKYFPDDQITFYQMAGDWKNYTKYVNVKIKKYPPQVGGKLLGAYGDAWTLNLYAWNLFEGCDDKQILSQGLPWVDKAIALDTSTYNSNYFDTKANLLYRIGRTKEAIQLEEVAVLRRPNQPAYLYIDDNLKKMKAGLATWPVKNNVDKPKR